MKTKRLIYFISRGKPHGLCILLKGIVPANCLLLVLMTLYSFVPAPLSESIELEKIPNLIIENNLRSGIDGDPLYTELKIQNPITGTVEDLGGPIPGVFVQVKDTNRTTMTDENGYYSISASPGEVLVFSYPGYETVEWIVGLDAVIDIEMYESFTYLDEAVINAGYYTVKDRERTGSIYRVTADEIEKQPVNNVLEALQGRVPGLDIVSTTGLAGGGYTVRIRGQNSIAAGNEPLYIIDGVPYDMSTMGIQSLSGGIIPRGNISPLNSIDPSTIESIEVLKDADATAIYGSRGANGVILITTRKGNMGKTMFSVEASSTFIKAGKILDLLNTDQYIKMRKKAYANDGILEYSPYDYDINGTWDLNRYTDWQKEFIGNIAVNNTIKFNISGGNKNTLFTLGGSTLKETTVFPFDYNYTRTAIHSNISHTSTNKRFFIQFSSSYGLDQNFLPASDLSQVALTLPPNAPALYDEEGNLNWENSTWINPYASLESFYRNKSQNLIASTLISYEIFKNLSFRTNLGYTNLQLNEINPRPNTMHDPAWGLTSSSSSYFKNESKRDSWIIEPQINSEFKIGQGSYSFLIGTTIQEQNFKQLALYGNGYPNNHLLSTLSAAQEINFLNDEQSKYKYLATYARANFIWNKKYIMNITGRRDGSSRFGANNKFSNFGAVGVAWIMSKENFLKNSPWLSFFKVRSSIGITGNDQIGDYQYLNTYTLTDYSYDNTIGLSPTRIYNPNYAWEKNRKVETGFQVSLWKERVNFELSYYNNRSNNLLVNIPLPTTTGFSSYNSNLLAKVENTGWEFSLNTKVLKKIDLIWDLGLHFSLPKTKLLEFPNLESSTYSNLLEIGYPLNIHKLYLFSGVNPETGIYEYVDFNGDGNITHEDRQYIADLNPKFLGNFSSSIIYKNLNFDFTFQFVRKKAFNEFYLSPPAGLGINQPKSVLDSWEEVGNNSSYQQYTAGYNFESYIAGYNYGFSSGAISDASFIKLKSVSLSYKLNLPKSLSPNCIVYLQGQNLITLTKFKGGDPEQTKGFLPNSKRLSLGFKIDF